MQPQDYVNTTLNHIVGAVSRVNGLTYYYNGRAGNAWLTTNKSEAFTYSAEGAARKAEMFNRATVLHGLTFKVLTL
jgi:hypothetical protein